MSDADSTTPVGEVTVTQEELAEFGELLNNIQSFIMSLDLRVRHIEAILYHISGTEEAAAEAGFEAPEPDAPTVEG